MTFCHLSPWPLTFYHTPLRDANKTTPPFTCARLRCGTSHPPREGRAPARPSRPLREHHVPSRHIRAPRHCSYSNNGHRPSARLHHHQRGTTHMRICDVACNQCALRPRLSHLVLGLNNRIQSLGCLGAHLKKENAQLGSLPCAEDLLSQTRVEAAEPPALGPMLLESSERCKFYHTPLTDTSPPTIRMRCDYGAERPILLGRVALPRDRC